MRRGFSILLILFFGFGPLSVLIGSEDASLPPCCRRHGAHRCAMAIRAAAMMRDALGKMPMAGVPMTCPEYPGPAALFAPPAPALTVSVAGLTVLRTQAHLAPMSCAAPESTPPRTHAGRGPPQTDLS